MHYHASGMCKIHNFRSIKQSNMLVAFVLAVFNVWPNTGLLEGKKRTLILDINARIFQLCRLFIHDIVHVYVNLYTGAGQWRHQ